MELVKNIYFNTDKLVENTDVKISYTGKLYQKNNGKVFIHYGYGEDWKNVNEIEMVKTDLGYQAELHLTNDNTINFCFKICNILFLYGISLFPHFNNIFNWYG